MYFSKRKMDSTNGSTTNVNIHLYIFTLVNTTTSIQRYQNTCVPVNIFLGKGDRADRRG